MNSDSMLCTSFPLSSSYSFFFFSITPFKYEHKKRACLGLFWIYSNLRLKLSHMPLTNQHNISLDLHLGVLF